MPMVLDNLILSVKDVTFDKYQAFMKDLGANLMTYEVMEHDGAPLTAYTKNTAREYHHNAIVGHGEGAVYIGYQHNSERYDVIRGCSMKVELNPNKENAEQKILANTFRKHFEGYTIYIRGMDLALDLEVEQSNLVIVSQTGRHQDRHKGTVYFGTRGKHGYLRSYNKKKELKEKQGIEIKSDSLTRIEFCMRMKDGLTLRYFDCLELKISNLYQISLLDKDALGTMEPVTKAILYSYLNGYQDLKEFTRTYKLKIKKALSNMNPVDLDQEFENAKADIKQVILKYVAVKVQNVCTV